MQHAKLRDDKDEACRKVSIFRQRQQNMAVLLWSKAARQNIIIAQRNFFVEWVRYVSTRTRGKLRRRLRGRLHVAGVIFASLVFQRRKELLLQAFFLLWSKIASRNTLAELLVYEHQQHMQAMLQVANKNAASHAAAALVFIAISDRIRLFQGLSFTLWAHKCSFVHPNTPSPPSEVVLTRYCRHNFRNVHDVQLQDDKHEMSYTVGCQGVCIVTPETKDTVCEMCSTWCGCGRPGCGTNPESKGKFYRVESGKYVVDGQWCKNERRWSSIADEGIKD